MSCNNYRVTSSTSSEVASPPPIPPRTSIFPAEDKVPVIIEPKGNFPRKVFSSYLIYMYMKLAFKHS